MSESELMSHINRLEMEIEALKARMVGTEDSSGMTSFAKGMGTITSEPNIDVIHAFPAKIISIGNAPFYAWQEVRTNSAGTAYSDTFGGQLASGSGLPEAYESNGATDISVDTYVTMIMHMDDDGATALSFSATLPPESTDPMYAIVDIRVNDVYFQYKAMQIYCTQGPTTGWLDWHEGLECYQP